MMLFIQALGMFAILYGLIVGAGIAVVATCSAICNAFTEKHANMWPKEWQR